MGARREKCQRETDFLSLISVSVPLKVLSAVCEVLPYNDRL